MAKQRSRKISPDEQVSVIHADALQAFKVIFKNVRVLGGLAVIMALVTVLIVGLPREFDTVVPVMLVVDFVILWLATIYLVRRYLAGEALKIRDGLFRGMTAFVPTVLVLLLVAVECLPVMLAVIAYPTAVETHVFDTPFYALLFVAFAGVMVWCSGMLTSASLVALAAVSAPGLYPMEALLMANELVRGKRAKLTVKVLILTVIVVAMVAVVVWPLATFGSMQIAWGGAMVVACFASVYAATYLYLQYRELINE